MPTTKIIYSMRIHTKLQLLGIPYLITMPNPAHPKYICWVYEETAQFLAAFDAIMKEEGGKKNGK